MTARALLCYCANVSVADVMRGLRRDSGAYCGACLGDLRRWLRRALGVRRRVLCYVPVVHSTGVWWHECPDDGQHHYTRIYGSDGSYTATHGRREQFESYAWWSPLRWVAWYRVPQWIPPGASVMILNLSDRWSRVNGVKIPPCGTVVMEGSGLVTLKGTARFGVYVLGPGEPRTIQHVK